MLIDGRAGLTRDEKQAFAFAAAGAALDCAHSKGVLGYCYVYGIGVEVDKERGLALGRESAAAGSCFGQLVFGECYESGCGGNVKDKAEAARLYRLAADQGYATAQTSLGVMFEFGLGVTPNQAEAVRWYLLADAQGDRSAADALKRLART